MSKPENIIIGAGISGLSCASVLKNCLVLEKEPFIGGLCRTVEFHGFRFDLGGHRLFSPDKKIEEEFKRLLKGDITEFKRKSKIWKNGRFIDYPLQTSVIFDLAPWQTVLSLVTYLYRKAFRLKGSSFRVRAINRFGDYLFKLFLEGYTEKVWGLNCNDISEDLVSTRLQDVSLRTAIQHILYKKSRVRSFEGTIIYPKRGIFQVIEKISENLNIALNSKVTGAAHSGGRIEKVIINNKDEFSCKNLISTMPITKLAEMLNAPEEIKDVARALRYRSIIFVFLVLKKDQFSENHWIYYPDRQIFGRIHEPKRWSAQMAPVDKTGICIEIFCDVKSEIWKMADDEIARLTIKDIPSITGPEVEEFHIVREEYAYPVYDIDHKSKTDKLMKYFASYKNLFLLGRFGSFRYLNMDICFADGIRLGRSLKEQPPMR